MINSIALHFTRSFIGALVLVTAVVLSPYAIAETVALGVSKAGIRTYNTETRDLPMEGATESFTANGITFNIWYQDVIDTTGAGFDDSTDGATRRLRMKETLTYVAAVINDTGTLDVLVDLSLNDGTGFLASAGTLNPCSDGFFPGATLQRLNTGSKPFGPNFEEIFVTVDFNFPWNEGTGAPAGGEFDLLTVLLHEITHGLGLFSLTDSTGGSVFVGGCGTSTFSTWDTKVVTSGNENLWSGSPPAFQVDVSELTSDALFFEGTNSVTLYDQSGTKPGVYAPGIWTQGSSLSHWDTDNIVGGALMEHSILIGTQRREYSPVDIGGLIDIGYVNAAAVGDPLDPDNVFVTFGGANGNGASTSPFNNLADAISAANASATINIDTGNSAETFTGGDKIVKVLSLVNNTPGSGSAVIGSAARNADDSSRSGFVSRMRKE